MNNPQHLEALLMLTARFVVNEANGQQRRTEAFLELQRALLQSAQPSAVVTTTDSDEELFRRLNAGLRIENSNLKGHIAVLEQSLREARENWESLYREFSKVVYQSYQKGRDEAAGKGE